MFKTKFAKPEFLKKIFQNFIKNLIRKYTNSTKKVQFKIGFLRNCSHLAERPCQQSVRKT